MPDAPDSPGEGFPDLENLGTRSSASKANARFSQSPPGASPGPPSSQPLPTPPIPSFSQMVLQAKDIERSAIALSPEMDDSLALDSSEQVGEYDSRLNETTYFEALSLARKIEGLPPISQSSVAPAGALAQGAYQQTKPASSAQTISSLKEFGKAPGPIIAPAAASLSEQKGSGSPSLLGSLASLFSKKGAAGATQAQKGAAQKPGAPSLIAKAPPAGMGQPSAQGAKPISGMPSYSPSGALMGAAPSSNRPSMPPAYGMQKPGMPSSPYPQPPSSLRPSQYPQVPLAGMPRPPAAQSPSTGDFRAMQMPTPSYASPPSSASIGAKPSSPSIPSLKKPEQEAQSPRKPTIPTAAFASSYATQRKDMPQASALGNGDDGDDDSKDDDDGEGISEREPDQDSRSRIAQPAYSASRAMPPPEIKQTSFQGMSSFRQRSSRPIDVQKDDEETPEADTIEDEKPSPRGMPFAGMGSFKQQTSREDDSKKDEDEGSPAAPGQIAPLIRPMPSRLHSASPGAGMQKQADERAGAQSSRPSWQPTRPPLAIPAQSQSRRPIEIERADDEPRDGSSSQAAGESISQEPARKGRVSFDKFEPRRPLPQDEPEDSENEDGISQEAEPDVPREEEFPRKPIPSPPRPAAAKPMSQIQIPRQEPATAPTPSSAIPPSRPLIKPTPPSIPLKKPLAPPADDGDSDDGDSSGEDGSGGGEAVEIKPSASLLARLKSAKQLAQKEKPAPKKALRASQKKDQATAQKKAKKIKQEDGEQQEPEPQSTKAAQQSGKSRQIKGQKISAPPSGGKKALPARGAQTPSPPQDDEPEQNGSSAKKAKGRSSVYFDEGDLHSSGQAGAKPQTSKSKKAAAIQMPSNARGRRAGEPQPLGDQIAQAKSSEVVGHTSISLPPGVSIPPTMKYGAASDFPFVQKEDEEEKDIPSDDATGAQGHADLHPDAAHEGQDSIQAAQEAGDEPAESSEQEAGETQIIGAEPEPLEDAKEEQDSIASDAAPESAPQEQGENEDLQSKQMSQEPKEPAQIGQPSDQAASLEQDAPGAQGEQAEGKQSGVSPNLVDQLKELHSAAQELSGSVGAAQAKPSGISQPPSARPGMQPPPGRTFPTKSSMAPPAPRAPSRMFPSNPGASTQAQPPDSSDSGSEQPPPPPPAAAARPAYASAMPRPYASAQAPRTIPGAMPPMQPPRYPATPQAGARSLYPQAMPGAAPRAPVANPAGASMPRQAPAQAPSAYPRTTMAGMPQQTAMPQASRPPIPSQAPPAYPRQASMPAAPTAPNAMPQSSRAIPGAPLVIPPKAANSQAMPQPTSGVPSTASPPAPSASPVAYPRPTLPGSSQVYSPPPSAPRPMPLPGMGGPGAPPTPPPSSPSGSPPSPPSGAPPSPPPSSPSGSPPSPPPSSPTQAPMKAAPSALVPPAASAQKPAAAQSPKKGFGFSFPNLFKPKAPAQAQQKPAPQPGAMQPPAGAMPPQAQAGQYPAQAPTPQYAQTPAQYAQQAPGAPQYPAPAQPPMQTPAPPLPSQAPQTPAAPRIPQPPAAGQYAQPPSPAQPVPSYMQPAQPPAPGAAPGALPQYAPDPNSIPAGTIVHRPESATSMAASAAIKSNAAITDELFVAYAREKHAWLYEIYKMGGITLEEFRRRVKEKMDADSTAGASAPGAGSNNLSVDKVNKAAKKFKK